MAETAKRGRGRQKGVKLSEDHRDKIRNSNILSYLIRHAEGKREMSATQVQAGLALLKKTLPDLTHNTHEGSEENPLNVINRIIICGPDD